MVESEYPETLSSVGFYLKNPFASLMVLPFEGFFGSFDWWKRKRMKIDEFWALWDVIWTRIKGEIEF